MSVHQKSNINRGLPEITFTVLYNTERLSGYGRMQVFPISLLQTTTGVSACPGDKGRIDKFCYN